MIEKLISLVIVVALGHWYWSNYIQASDQSDYGQELLENAENMKKCMRAENYKVGTTGQASGIPEQTCAEHYNLYRGDDGQWHSYSSNRP